MTLASLPTTTTAYWAKANALHPRFQELPAPTSGQLEQLAKLGKIIRLMATGPLDVLKIRSYGKNILNYYSLLNNKS